jgi:hypothetical protein
MYISIQLYLPTQLKPVQRANNGRDDNNNRGGPEPQVKEEQLERSKRCTGICTGRYFILFPSK